MKLPFCLPTSQKLKVGGRFLSTGEALKESGASLLSRAYSWGGAGLEHQLLHAKSAPFLSGEPVRGPSQGLTMAFWLRALLGPDCRYCWCQSPGTLPPWSPPTPSILLV